MSEKLHQNSIYQRLIIQHDPLIGYRFLPKIYSIRNYNGHEFIVQTNEQGFRDNKSFDKKKNNCPRILALGDSHLAGDGLNNEDRFTDLVSKKLGVEVMNMGLPGSGTDQQLLIQEKIASQWDYDVLLIMPFVRNLNRNFMDKLSFMEHAISFVLEWKTGKRLLVQKPFYTISKTGKLTLNNVPVPPIGTCYKEFEKKASFLRKKYRELRKAVNGIQYRFGYQSADREYRDANGGKWNLMKKLLEQMISNAKQKPVIIIPIPRKQHIIYSAFPEYLSRFKELSSDQVKVLDILPILHKSYKNNRRSFFLPDGHFSAATNNLISEFCVPAIEKAIDSGRKRSDNNDRLQQFNTETDNIMLGVSYNIRGASAVVARNGKIICAGYEEYFSGKRDDSSFPYNAINNCLESARIARKNVSNISISTAISEQKNVNKHVQKRIDSLYRDAKVTIKNALDYIYKGTEYFSPFKHFRIFSFIQINNKSIFCYRIGKDECTLLSRSENSMNSFLDELAKKYLLQITENNNVVLTFDSIDEKRINTTWSNLYDSKHVWCCPIPNGMLSAVGAAMSFSSNNFSESYPTKNHFIGPAFSSDEFESFLNLNSYNFVKVSKEERAEKIYQELLDDKCIVYCGEQMDLNKYFSRSRLAIYSPIGERFLDSVDSEYTILMDQKPVEKFVGTTNCFHKTQYFKIEKDIRIDGGDQKVLTKLTKIGKKMRILVNCQYEDNLISSLLQKFKVRNNISFVIIKPFVNGYGITPCVPEDIIKTFFEYQADGLMYGKTLMFKSGNIR